MAENRALKTKMNEMTTSANDEEGLLTATLNGKTEIRAATTEKLIERLYNQDQLSGTTFLSTCKPISLQFLIMWTHSSSPFALSRLLNKSGLLSQRNTTTTLLHNNPEQMIDGPLSSEQSKMK